MIYRGTEKRREQRTEEILEQALDIVVQHGLDALTVGKLARRMDWTVGAMYRYFASKDDLVSALTARVLEDWLEELAVAQRAVADRPPIERLESVLHAWIDLTLDRPGELSLVSVMLADPRHLFEKLEEAAYMPFLLALIQGVGEAVVAAIDAGELSPTDDPGSRALQLIFACQGVLQLRKMARLDPDTYDVRRLARRQVADLLTAWTPS